jgi:hypothetical protein
MIFHMMDHLIKQNPNFWLGLEQGNVGGIAAA